MIGRASPTRQVRVQRHASDGAVRVKDTVAVEEPLEIRVAWMDGATARVEPVAVTMRTPGEDFELVAGFLHGEGIVTERSALEELTYCRSGEAPQEYNVVEARLRPGVAFDLERLRRNVFTTSSCGVCGKASLEAVEAVGCEALEDGVRVAASTVVALPNLLLERQDVFERTGGLHAAGLFDAEGEALGWMEDVGRHNAVDKVLGRTFLAGELPARGRVLVVSGRASFEIVQKALMASVPVLVAVGAPSSLAVDLAARFGQTLVGFARGAGFNIYSGAERIT